MSDSTSSLDSRALVLGAAVGAGVALWASSDFLPAVRDRYQLYQLRRRQQKAAASAGQSPSPEVPENAPESCPGVGSDAAGKADGCAGCPNQKACSSGAGKEEDPMVNEVAYKLRNVKRKILILSGKGGVGKSTVSSQLAFTLASSDRDVGLLDVDICGPSIPRMLGINDGEVHQSAEGWQPVYVDDRLAVMSIGFMLTNKDDAIVWRGPRKHGLIRQFLTDVTWGHLDVLLVDTPPGTSDEHLSMVNYLKDCQPDGAVLVTTPQEVALQDVRKEINFCRGVGLPIIGVIENMSGFECPCCGKVSEIFMPNTGGAKQMCKDMDVPFLGSIPLNNELQAACEKGLPIIGLGPDSKPAQAVKEISEKIMQKVEERPVVKGAYGSDF
ncbi:cytosolic Fe-S cluster assembly factor nbp35 [Perkinsus olseni]|uniref:Cytosolic Fe-S cluster assembly factor NUBP1 homolog n=1 Tax=Perkinsus olseni TaxID=32597 RepID=A0A7J6L945_PEROL|nr:cytosolic Fe-S cluster assembly factor nbp35 [Perkinsus olseni]